MKNNTQLLKLDTHAAKYQPWSNTLNIRHIKQIQHYVTTLLFQITAILNTMSINQLIKQLSGVKTLVCLIVNSLIRQKHYIKRQQMTAFLSSEKMEGNVVVYSNISTMEPTSVRKMYAECTNDLSFIDFCKSNKEKLINLTKINIVISVQNWSCMLCLVNIILIYFNNIFAKRSNPDYIILD